MKLQPIVYTTSMERAVDWYSAVLGGSPRYQSDVWTSFGVGDADLALHRVDDLGQETKVEVSLVCTEALEMVVDRLASSGIPIERGIQEETFGRSVVLRDPDGLIIQVNEHETHDE